MKFKILLALFLLFITACTTDTGNVNTGVNLPKDSTMDKEEVTIPVQETSGREIKVSLFQFGFEPDPITLNYGEKVTFVLSTKDVAHGFAIKDLGINVRVDPGKEERLQFTADKKGEFVVSCSVSCGPGHKEMKGKLIVQ